MNTTYIFTGYNDCTFSKVRSPSSVADSDEAFGDLLDQIMDFSECQYTDVDKLPAGALPVKYRGDQGLSQSILLGRVPWFTSLVDIFESSPDMIKEAMESLQNDFSASLQGTDENSRAYCGALRGEFPSTCSPRSYPHLASRLLTMRFMDICCGLAQADSEGSTAIRPEIDLSGLKFVGLQDWVETLKNAKAILTSQKIRPIPVRQTGTLTAYQLKCQELYMYSERSQTRSDRMQIYANGHLDNPQGTKDANEEFGASMNAPLEGWSSLSRTLELAISVGPVVLFNPKKLSSNRTSRMRLTKLWIQRGSSQNSSVWSAERRIWLGLIKIARGASLEDEVLRVIEGAIDESADSAARGWYNFTDDLLQKHGKADGDDVFKLLGLQHSPPCVIATPPLIRSAESIPPQKNVSHLSSAADSAISPPQTPPPTPTPTLNPPGPGLTASQDIEMQIDAIPSAISRASYSPTLEKPEGVRDPPTYEDCMDVDDSSHNIRPTLSHFDPMDLNVGAGTLHLQHAGEMDVGMGPQSIDASHGLTTDTEANECRAPPKKKRRRLNSGSLVSGSLSSVFPEPSNHQGPSLQKRVIPLKRHKTAFTPKLLEFDSMSEAVAKDAAREKNSSILNSKGLDAWQHPQRVQGVPVAFQIPYSYEWTPSFHFHRDLTLFHRMCNTSIKSTSHPNVTSMAYSEYLSLNADALLDKMRGCHLVLTNCPIVSRSFDQAGLVRLGALSKKIAAQDHSIYEYLHDKQGKPATLGQMLLASSYPNGRALSSLELPRSAPPDIALRFSTDCIAWDQAHGEMWCTDGYPTTAMRWGICSTVGSYQRARFIPEGFGTFVYPESGASIWMVAVPKKGKSFDDLTSLRIPITQEVGLDHADSEVDWVPVTLTPGTALIMRPNALYAVFTASNAVCIGGHYLSTTTLHDTCCGVYHSLVAGNSLIDRGNIREAFMLLARVVAFYSISLMGSDYPEVDGSYLPQIGLDKDDPRRHLPDLTTFDGILDVSSLFCILELGNALSPSTYGEADGVEHGRIACASKRANTLQSWISTRYQLLDQNGNSVDYRRGFYWPYLAQNAKALVALSSAKEGDSMEKLMATGLQHGEEFWKVYRGSDCPAASFYWTGPQLRVHKIEHPPTGC